MAEQNERSGTANGEMQAQGNGNGNGKRSNRGFASMDAARQREIASKGGKAAHAKGTAHEWTPDEARVAGRKGGEAVSRDRAHMAAIGREGGGARSARRNTPPRGSEAVQGGDERGGREGREDRGERGENANR